MENQLALFTLLTDEQEIEKNRRIGYFKEQYLKNEKLNISKRNILLYNGFIEGSDFIYESVWEEKEIEFVLGNSYNNTNITIKETLNVYKGSCNIRYKQYSSYNKELKFITYSFDINGGTINCYGLTNNQRYIKPSTLLQKLRDKNIRSESEYEKDNKDQIILDYTIDKYKKLYPEAEIKTDKEYTENRGLTRSNYETYNVVKITFKSGSYVTFRLGWEKDKEFLHNKYDAVVSKMSYEKLMDIFNSQPNTI